MVSPESELQPNLRGTEQGQLLELVFQHVGEGICVFDAGLALRAANSRMADLIGLPESLLAPGTPLATWLRCLAESGQYGEVDVAAEVARRLDELSQPVPGVVRRERLDGRVIELRRTPLPEGGFALVCVDISERLASEAALFENRRTLDALLRRTEEGFWFIDNQQVTTDANPAMCRLLGISREALIGRPIWDFVDAENEAIFRQQVAQRNHGLASTYEITLRRADGGAVVCVNNATPIHDAQGHKIGSIGLFSNVTAQREGQAVARAAMALAAEKSRVLALTLDSLAQGVLGFDASLRLHSWNRRAVELLELPQSLLDARPTLMEIGRWQEAQGAFGPQFGRIEGQQARVAVQREMGKSVADHQAMPTYRRQRADGRIIEVQVHRGDDGGQVRTYTDVTAEVQASNALLAAKEEAERANRAKSEFLSRMSHELRTPLNAILGFGQLMQRDSSQPLPAAQMAWLQQILNGGQHLLTLINEVLDLARIETGLMQMTQTALDADALIDECVRLVEPVAHQRPVRLHARQGSAGLVRADPQRLRQVLLNLLANAIKYNRPQGEVSLCCSVQGSQARIEVRDTGPGLDATQQQRLFRPFERLGAEHDSVEGTGIGLSISRALVDLMGGRIGVHSQPGEGSCFWVELASAPGDSASPRPHRHDAPSATVAAAPRQVLYIEDNPVNQLVMQGMLGHRPWIDLRLAASADEGLAMAQAAPPDLVLLDIQLPGSSGYEVLRALRDDGRTRAVPVLAVSANAMPSDLAQARAAGFDGYLTKPLALQDLLDTLDRWLVA